MPCGDGGEPQQHAAAYISVQPLPAQPKGRGAELNSLALKYSLTVQKCGASSGARLNALAGSKRAAPEPATAHLDAAGAGGGWPASPPHGKRQQQQRECRLVVRFTAPDGRGTVTTKLRGYVCPFSSCRIRCRHYAGLQHHLQASHHYYSCHFEGERAGEAEVTIRCNPGARAGGGLVAGRGPPPRVAPDELAAARGSCDPPPLPPPLSATPCCCSLR